MKIEIKSRYNSTTIFTAEAESLLLAVEAAVKSGANLSGAVLSGANLTRANLYGADLYGADLRSAGIDVQSIKDRGANVSRIKRVYFDDELQ